MSQNVEIVRAGLQAFTDGGVDAAAELFDADVNWRAIEGAPDDVGEMHGRERVRRYFGELLETFANVTATPVELLDIGDDRVVAVQHLAGRGKLSGIETEMRFAVVYTLRNGKIARGREYIDRQQASKPSGWHRRRCRRRTTRRSGGTGALRWHLWRARPSITDLRA